MSTIVKVVSDAHANYPALKRATESYSSDINIFLGDIIGIWGYPSETVEHLQEEYDYVLKGNHDIAVLEHDEGHVNDKEISQFEHDYVKEQLSEEQQDWIRSLDSIRDFERDGENFLMCHGNPVTCPSGIRKVTIEEKHGRRIGMGGGMRTDINYVGDGYVDSYQYRQMANNFEDEYDYLMMGHTHDQSVRHTSDSEEDITVLNPGSVGVLQDGKASYATVSTEYGIVDRHNIEVSKDLVKERLSELDAPFAVAEL